MMVMTMLLKMRTRIILDYVVDVHDGEVGDAADAGETVTSADERFKDFGILVVIVLPSQIALVLYFRR